jgi:hemerythrin
MPLISINMLWNDKMSVGVDYIDEHHKALIGLLIEAKRAVEGSDREMTRAVLTALTGYTKFHFLAEERFMLEIRYPGIDRQREAHRSFVVKLSEIEDLYARDPKAAGKDLVAYLTNWFIAHIAEEDARIGEHYRSNVR